MTVASHERDRLRCAPCVKQLHISDCPNISVSDLKKLIETRYTGFNCMTPIEELHIGGNIPELSPHNVQRLERYVSHFFVFSV
jgi:hypothetical protein